MKQELYFDFRDVFRFPRLALSGKKLWTFFIANVVGFVGFIILSYLAIIISGHSFSTAWTQYHFFPFPYGIGLSTLGWIIYFLGGLFWAVAYYLANLAVARITYKELKGDFFFSSGDGWQFVKKHWHPLIFAPLSVIGIIVFFLIMAIIAALLGKIPYVGEFIFSIPYLLYFPVAIFVLYSLIILGIVLTFTPAIVATSEEDTLEAVFQSYSLLWAQPWRLVVYEGIWGALSSLAIYIFGVVMTAGIGFISFVFGMSWLMGDKVLRILQASFSHLGGESPVLYIIFRIFSFLSGGGGTGYATGAISGTEAVAAVFLAIAIFVILAVIVSYACALDSIGQTLIYLVLRKKKDDENLLERKDEDELEEEEEEFAEEAEDEDLASGLETEEEENEAEEPGEFGEDDSDDEASEDDEDRL